MSDLPEKYSREKITVSVLKANLYAVILILPILVLYFFPYYLIWGSFQPIEIDGVLTIIMIIAGIVIHELLHGLSWALFAKNKFKSIKFGIIWKFLTPYCHCKDPLTVKHYIIGTITPFIVLGLIPVIFAIFINSTFLLSFGAFFTIAAGGDIYMAYLLRNENKDSIIQDHPSEVGCYIYRTD